MLRRAEQQLQPHAEARFRYKREFALSRFPDDRCAEASAAPTTHPIASADYRQETALPFFTFLFLCSFFVPPKAMCPRGGVVIEIILFVPIAFLHRQLQKLGRFGSSESWPCLRPTMELTLCILRLIQDVPKAPANRPKILPKEPPRGQISLTQSQGPPKQALASCKPPWTFSGWHFPL